MKDRDRFIENLFRVNGFQAHVITVTRRVAVVVGREAWGTGHWAIKDVGICI
jgi:hypothetical protein